VSFSGISYAERLLLPGRKSGGSAGCYTLVSVSHRDAICDAVWLAAIVVAVIVPAQRPNKGLRIKKERTR
jgi:hypothetical protein